MGQFVNVGDAVPEVVLPALDGKPVSLSSYSGKKLLIFMWASW